jgi:hypothetical protein
MSHGPPYWSGPGSEKKMRVAGERSHNRSGNRRASLKPHSSNSSSDSMEPGNLLNSPVPTMVLRPRRRSRFDVLIDDMQIVTSSAQPICDAARILHRLGHSDDCRITVWHEGADHNAISGLLGFWRKKRIREDRGPPRYVGWEARPRPVWAKKGLSEPKPIGDRANEKNAPTMTPGADKGHAPNRRPRAPGPLHSGTRGRGA